MSNFLTLRRPLTTKMEELLMDCHEIEILKLAPYEAGSVPYARGLIERGMLGTKFYINEKGKRIVCLYVTLLGREYLKRF